MLEIWLFYREKFLFLKAVNTAFDSNYNFDLYDALKLSSSVKNTADDLERFIDKDLTYGSFKMNFIDNHDKNTYDGTLADRFGEEVEKEIRYNIKAEEVVTSVDENGNAVTETVKVMDGTDDPNSYSDYARFFDESCAAWQNDAEYNLTFLKAQQQYANDLLKARGRLFLNEVYRMLGIDETKAGQVVGWVYNPDNPTGDNFVDFGIYNMQRERVRAFVNGYEPNILLDFNVDGVIWDLAW